jgi:membrane protease YdiL (CAAX protease family)
MHGLSYPFDTSPLMTPVARSVVLLVSLGLWMVAVRHHAERAIFAAGLGGVVLYLALATLGDSAPRSVLASYPLVSPVRTLASALVALGAAIVYSPVADRLASRWVSEPPRLRVFEPLKRSRRNLVMGIAVAWLLGGFIEEFVFRGVVLVSTSACLSRWLAHPPATAVAICAAAFGAGLFHSYQGLRAVIVVTQLSVLFGVLFVATGYDLWATVLCHGLYDTIAFVRFARGGSSFSRHDRVPDVEDRLGHRHG